MLRLVPLASLPHDGARGRQRGCSIGAEMHIHAIAVDYWRRRRAAIFEIEQRAVRQVEDFDVHQLAAGFLIEGDRAKRPTLVGGGCQPDAAVRHNWRRPAAAGYGNLPDDVAALAPLEREVALRRVTLPVR